MCCILTNMTCSGAPHQPLKFLAVSSRPPMQHNSEETEQETDEERDEERERITEREIGEKVVWMTTGIETEIEIHKAMEMEMEVDIGSEMAKEVEISAQNRLRAPMCSCEWIGGGGVSEHWRGRVQVEWMQMWDLAFVNLVTSKQLQMSQQRRMVVGIAA